MRLPFDFPVLAFRRNGRYEWHGPDGRVPDAGPAVRRHAQESLRARQEKKPRFGGAFPGWQSANVGS
jgi:hypothetical protein